MRKWIYTLSGVIFLNLVTLSGCGLFPQAIKANINHQASSMDDTYLAIEKEKEKFTKNNNYTYTASVNTIFWAKQTLGFQNHQEYPDSEPVCVVSVTGTTNPSVGLSPVTGETFTPENYGFYSSTTIYRKSNLQELYSIGNYSLTRDDHAPLSSKPIISE